MNRHRLFGYASAALALSAPLAADELTGAQFFMCSAWHAAVCNTDGSCDATEAWRLNMPDFLQVDVRGKVMKTPDGSDQPRESPIATLVREAGKLFMSGHQETRGWTWIINETSGEGVLALVSDNSSVTLFTVCTATDPS
jgi:hypothetical protein